MFTITIIIAMMGLIIIEKKKEEPQETRSGTGRPVPASVSFVPGVAGLMIAGEVIRDLVFNKA